MVTQLEPDILGCEVKWALGSITINKASGCDEIIAELVQILKDWSFKVMHFFFPLAFIYLFIYFPLIFISLGLITLQYYSGAQYVSKFRKLSSGHSTEKGQFSFQAKERQ